VERVEVLLLGPFELRLAGRPIALTAYKQRVLVAVLALRAGDPVRRDELIDALWGERPPSTVEKGLNVLVARVRQVLGESGDILRRDTSGYALMLAPDAVDAHRFERMHAEGRRALEHGDPAKARGLLREALELWRGSALGELAGAEFVQGEVRRLEELRLVALEDRVDADVAAGEDAALVSELAALTALHPFRERLHGQLMLALYRSGRQAEALEHYRRTHRLLGEELGIEPGPDLQKLHEALLRHAPEVAPERREPRPAAATSRRSSRRRAVAVVSACLVVVTAVVLALTKPWESDTGGRQPLVSVPSGALIALDPRSGLRLSSIRVGKAPSAVAVGPSGVWVVNGHDGTLSRIDPVRRTLTDTIGVGGAVTDVAVTESDVWVSSIEPPALIRVDPRLSSVGAKVPVAIRGAGRARLAVGAGSIWVARDLVRLERVSAAAGRVVARFPLQASGGGIALGLGAVWVPTIFPKGLVTVPLNGGAARRLPSKSVVADVAIAGGAVWLAIPEENRVARLDPRRMTITDSVRADGASALAAGRGGIWVASRSGKTLSRIDPRSRRVAQTVRLTASPSALALGADALWVVTGTS
jgi:DNA-binding SARP family transcriptional activator